MGGTTLTALSLTVRIWIKFCDNVKKGHSELIKFVPCTAVINLVGRPIHINE